MIFGNKFKYKHIQIVTIANCLFISSSVFLSGCFVANEVEVKTKKAGKDKSTSTSLPPVTVSKVEVINHQIIITGTNLTSVSQFRIKEGSTNTTLQIESKTATTIVANTLSNVTFAAGKILDFIFTNAEAASTFTVNFSLCDSTLGGKGFNCLITPNDKEVLSYDAATGKWKPRAVNGLSYQGAWDANDPQPTTTAAGDYFIVSVANAPYSVGDWIVFNGTSFDHINNSSAITTVFGRTGVITANEGDYVLDKMGDVDLTTSPPITGDVLKFNGTKWIPGTVSAGSGGTVTNVTGSGPISVTSGASTPAISISQSNSTTSGYLSNTDWNTFNNKQPTITAGTTAQYYRGDKTWQTLDTSVVLENVNLYFTNARALGVPLTGFATNNAVIVATDTILQAFGKAQGQIDNLTAGGSNYIVKNGIDTVTGVVNFNTVGALSIGYTPTNLTDATSKSYVDAQRDSRVAKTGDTMSGDLQLNTVLKFKDSGSNTATLQAPTTITTSYVLKLPSALGTNNQVLTTDAAGNLSWTTPATSGAPSGSAGGDLGGTYPNPTISGLAATKVGGGAVDNTEFGYLDGVTSSIQTQLNAKLSSFTETDPSVSAFAKAALPTCAAGEVLKSNGTTLSCVTDNSGAGAFTGSNSIVVVTDGAGALSSSSITTTELGYVSGVTSAIQTQLNAKQATISKTTVQDVSKLRIYGANVTNYVELSAAALSGNRSLIFPDSNGANGNVLTTDGSGNLSWSNLATTSPVTSVNTLTGAVTLTTTNIAEGTNFYYTNARGIASTITAPTLTNSAITTGDSLQIVAGKLQAQFNNVLNVALTGLSTATNATIAATDSILVAFGKLQAQITGQATDISNKADRTNIAQTITAATVTGLSAPLVGADATNKTYVDAQVAGASNQWTLSGSDIYRSSGKVGIGTTSPQYPLHVVGTLNNLLELDQYSNDAVAPAIRTRKARGTQAVPSQVLLNDRLFGIYGNSYHDSGWATNNTVAIQGFATEAHTSATQGTAISFETTASGAIARTERMRIDSTGNVGIGTISPTAGKLQITGDDLDYNLALENYSNTTGSRATALLQRRALGTAAAPLAITSGTVIGGTYYSGYHSGGAFSANIAAVRAVASENFTATAQGTDLIFRTTPPGTAAAVESVYFKGNGSVGIGVSNPLTKFEVAKDITAQNNTVSDPLAWNQNSQFKLSSGNNALSMSVVGVLNQRLGIIQAGHNGDGNGAYANLTDPKLALQPYGGYVGIGVLAPTATLHVNGTTRLVDGNQGVARVLASDASGNAAWKQTIIHGNIAAVANTSTSSGNRVSSGVSITLPPGRWQITGMGITTGASCRADFGIRVQATDTIVKYTLFPPATGDFQTATVTGYVDIASTTTYDLFISSRGVCNSQIHTDNNLWDLTATGVAY